MLARSVTALFALLLCLAPAARGDAPAHRWSAAYGGTSGNQYGMDVATDEDGCLYATGYYYTNIDLGGGTLANAGGSDVYLAKFDADGNHLWSRGFGGTGYEIPFALALDSAGHILLTGRFSGAGNLGGGGLTAVDGYDVFVARYAGDGSHLWSAGFGGTGTDTGIDIAATPTNDVVVVGEFPTSVNFGGGVHTSAGGTDIFLAGFESDGDFVFSRSFGNTEDDEGNAVAVSLNNVIYMTGSARVSIDFGGGVLTSAGYADAYLAAFDKTGVHAWSSLFGDTAYQYGEELCCDSAGHVILNGYFAGTIDLGGGAFSGTGTYDMFMAKFSGTGSHLWSRDFGLSGWNNEAATSVDGDDNLLLASRSSGSIDFGGGVLSTHGGNDICAAKFAADGTHLWSGIYGSSGSDETRGAAALPDGGIVITGYIASAVDFGGGPITPISSNDAYLVRFIDPHRPVITTISDVANDQGRFVRIEFTASTRDVAGSPTPVLQYEAYRRIDALPGAAAAGSPAVAGSPISKTPGKLAGWEFAGAVPAHGEAEYALIAPTLADSTLADGMHWSTFLIRAATADPCTFWDSFAAAGYSLDNLAPAVPAGLSMPAGDLLAWDEVADADFDYYTVYASATPDFSSPVLVGRTVARQLVVAGTGGDYLAVTATDFSGNESALSVFVRNVTGVPGLDTARSCVLHPCAPNPFNPATTLRFDLPNDARATLRIYSLDGRLVATLVDRPLAAGTHHATWHGRDDRGQRVPSGTYLCRLAAGSFVRTQRMQLVK